MPVMDGVAATVAIRASDSAEATIPIIALTANTMEDDKRAYLAAGIDGVVGKPVDRATLLNAIAAARDARHTQHAGCA